MITVWVILGLMLILIGWVVKLEIDDRKWKYRNPFARECKRCGRHENLYTYYCTDHVWEQVYPLPHSPEKCKH